MKFYNPFYYAQSEPVSLCVCGFPSVEPVEYFWYVLFFYAGALIPNVYNHTGAVPGNGHKNFFSRRRELDCIIYDVAERPLQQSFVTDYADPVRYRMIERNFFIRSLWENLLFVF